MADQRLTQDDVVKDLTRYLTESHRDPYRGEQPSPIQRAVQHNLVTITEQMAQTVVSNTPGLHDKIRAMVTDAVTRALADDKLLRDMVTDSVAKALVANYRENDDE